MYDKFFNLLDKSINPNYMSKAQLLRDELAQAWYNKDYYELDQVKMQMVYEKIEKELED